jgi:hypothetical protein
MGPGEDVVGECNDNDRGLDDGIVGFVTSVKDLSLPFFCHQLVEHFTIMFQLNIIKWPKHSRGYGLH